VSEEILSQAEVDSLLKPFVNKPSIAEQPKSDTEPTATATQSLDPASNLENITSYDFRRLENLEPDQIRTLQAMHETFARDFAIAISSMLRGPVESRLISVDQLTYSEFVFSLDNPSCFNVIKTDRLDDHLVLDMHPSVLFPIISRLLGGTIESSKIARRPLTEIELRLATGVTDLFLAELTNAWTNIRDLDLSVARVESNPQLVQIVPPNTPVVLVRFELTMADVRGMINLCIPFHAVKQITTDPIDDRVAPKNLSSLAGEHETSPEPDSFRLDVALSDSTISSTDLLQLNVGDMITTDHLVEQPLNVSIDGVLEYRARAGAYCGRKAIEILGPFELPEDGDSDPISATCPESGH